MRFQVLTAANMKFRFVFWDVLPCKIIVDRRFRGTCCLHHQGDECPDDGGSMYVWRRLIIILHGSTPRRQICTIIWLCPATEISITFITQCKTKMHTSPHQMQLHFFSVPETPAPVVFCFSSDNGRIISVAGISVRCFIKICSIAFCDDRLLNNDLLRFTC
jgi:hypothetical protein